MIGTKNADLDEILTSIGIGGGHGNAINVVEVQQRVA